MDTFSPVNRVIRFILILGVLLGWTHICAARDYRLGAGDMVTVTLYEHPDMKSTVRIGGDGTIALPLLGQIPANNLTVKHLAEKIESLLADGFIVEPQVHIHIEEFRSRKVTILGEVRKPGVYEIKGHTTILELISQADGLTAQADYRAIVQNWDGEKKDIPVTVVDLGQLMRDGRASENISIVDGDHVYIPAKEVFYVSGQVKKPGVYTHEQGLTVIRALTMAGGPSDKAAPDRTRIIRTGDGQEHLIRGVRMDMPVQPNDVIVVPESFF